MATEDVGDWKSPQFFKPFLPDSYQQLAIPKAFLKHIGGELCKDGQEVLLRNHRCRGKSWPVRLKGFCFEQGWSDFARDHNLRLGDFLVFRHVSRLVFDVIVFGHSACEKKRYPALDISREEDEMEVEDDSSSKEKVIKGSIPLSGRPMTRYSNRTKASLGRSNGGKVAKSQDPSFEVSRTQFKVKKPLVRQITIPKKFLISNGLVGRIFEVIIRDPRGRLWPVRLNHDVTIDRFRFGRGWSEFVSANHLKERDTCVFNLSNSVNIYNRGSIVLDFTLSSSRNRRESASSSRNRRESTSSSRNRRESANPSFAQRLTAFNFKCNLLYVPANFARLNGLKGVRCMTTLKDGNGRSWRVLVKQWKSDRRVYISGDWAEIYATNGLKEGDTCTLMLTRKGKQQVMEFSLL